MTQLSLFEAVTSAPGCRHGVPLLVQCSECTTEVERLIAEFRAAVARGEYNEQGFKLRGKK